VDDPLLDPVGESPGVETVLELTASIVVKAHVPIFSGIAHDHQTIRGQDASGR
jgi:hypothetical protein